MRWMTAIAFATLGLLCLPRATAQEPEESTEGYWLCPDGTPSGDGWTTIASNISEAKTYRVHNETNDYCAVKVYDDQNVLIETLGLGPNQSVDTGVPRGGDLKVTDPNDENTIAPGGSFEVV